MTSNPTEPPRRRAPIHAPLRWTETVTPEVAYLLVGQLLQAIETRDLIGQAKGILMARYGIDADTAYARLVDQSKRTNTKLRIVVEQVVESAAPFLTRAV